MSDETKGCSDTPNRRRDAINASSSTVTWFPEPIEREIPADAYSAITQALVAAKDPHYGWMELRDGLVDYLKSIEKPMLGLATTRELCTELAARVEVNGTADYRTVDHHA